MRAVKLLPIPMLQVRRAAYILGNASAAAKALEEYKQRVREGEDVRFFQDTQTKAIVVGPHLPPLPVQEESK